LVYLRDYNLCAMNEINPVASRLLAQISRVIEQNGCETYLVGGFVRDFLLKKDTADIDIAVNGDTLSIGRNLADVTNGSYVLLDESNRIVRIIIPVGETVYNLDIAPMAGDIISDMGRRDFTINAIAMKLEDIDAGTSSFIDPYGGLHDLKSGIVRAVSDNIFEDDAVRLLRAVRMAAELEFSVDFHTESLMTEYASLASSVSGERLREEFLKIIALPGASEYIRYLDKVSLLTAIIPELRAMKNIEQPKEHYWDVFNHSVEMVDTVEFILRDAAWRFADGDLLSATPWTDGIRRHFDEKLSPLSSRRTLMKLGALLHDIAKPQTKAVTDTGRTRFIGHTKQGAAVAVDILTRLRFSGKEIDYVERLVYNHLRPVQMSNGGLPTGKAIYRYFRDTRDAGIDILYFALADYLAMCGPRVDNEEWQAHNTLVSHILAEHYRQETTVLPVSLLDGNDLMELFNLSPGPLIGKLLVYVREAHINGQIQSRYDAIELVKKKLEKSAK